jgi:hypothetical protein
VPRARRTLIYSYHIVLHEALYCGLSCLPRQLPRYALARYQLFCLPSTICLLLHATLSTRQEHATLLSSSTVACITLNRLHTNVDATLTGRSAQCSSCSLAPCRIAEPLDQRASNTPRNPPLQLALRLRLRLRRPTTSTTSTTPTQLDQLLPLVLNSPPNLSIRIPPQRALTCNRPIQILLALFACPSRRQMPPRSRPKLPFHV